MPTIKRYANRKLYDTEAKRYVTLNHIATMIRDGVEVHIVDHETGEDLTAQTQAQIIFEQQKKPGSLLPRAVFTDIIQSGTHTLGQLQRALIPPSEWKRLVDAEIEKRINTLIEKGQLAEIEGMRLVEQLSAVGDNGDDSKLVVGEEEIEHYLKARAVPSRDELKAMVKQVETLAAELDKLSKSKR